MGGGGAVSSSGPSSWFLKSNKRQNIRKGLRGWDVRNEIGCNLSTCYKT